MNGTASAPGSPRENAMARSSTSASAPVNAPDRGTAWPSAARRSFAARATTDELEGPQDRGEIVAGEALDLLEKGSPRGRVVEPDLPPSVERLLDGRREAPEGDRLLRVVDLAASVSSNREHRACLREAVRARESTAERGRAQPAELAFRVPPPGEIHLAEAGHDETELQEAVEVDQG